MLFSVLKSLTAERKLQLRSLPLIIFHHTVVRNLSNSAAVVKMIRALDLFCWSTVLKRKVSFISRLKD